MGSEWNGEAVGAVSSPTTSVVTPHYGVDMWNIQLVPESSEGCGLCAMGDSACPYHANGGSLLLELLGPRIKFTRKDRVMADGQDIGRWEKLGDREWEAHLDDGSFLSTDRFHKLEFEVLKAIASKSDDDRLRKVWEHHVAHIQSEAA